MSIRNEKNRYLSVLNEYANNRHEDILRGKMSEMCRIKFSDRFTRVLDKFLIPSETKHLAKRFYSTFFAYSRTYNDTLLIVLFRLV